MEHNFNPDYVTFSQAIKLKENLFDLECKTFYKVIHNNKESQRLNRFYPSSNLNEGYIYKMRHGSLHHLLKDSGVTLFNDYVKGPYDINYDYFITKCNEIINQLEPKQLNLF